MQEVLHPALRRFVEEDRELGTLIPPEQEVLHPALRGFVEEDGEIETLIPHQYELLRENIPISTPAHLQGNNSRRSWDAGRTYGTYYPRPVRKVHRLTDMKRADHILFERCAGLYEHHALVKSINLEMGTFIVFESTKRDSNTLEKVTFGESELRFDDVKTHLFVMEYTGNSHLADDDVIRNAERLANDCSCNGGYNLLLKNCENNVVHCKTGISLRRLGDQAIAMQSKLQTLLKLLDITDDLLYFLLPFHCIANLLICLGDWEMELALIRENCDDIAGETEKLKRKYRKLVIVHITSSLCYIGGTIGGATLGAGAGIIFQYLSGNFFGHLSASVPWLIYDLIENRGSNCWTILKNHIILFRQLCWIWREIKDKVPHLLQFIYTTAGEVCQWVKDQVQAVGEWIAETASDAWKWFCSFW